MASNVDLLGDEAALRQIIENDFSATDGVFEDNESITIGKNAFRSKSLKKAVFLKVTSISSTAFYYNTNLEEVDFPKLTTIIGSGAFEGSFKAGVKVCFPEVTRLTADSVFKTAKADSIILPKLESIVNNTFNGASVKLLDLGNLGATNNNTFIGNQNLVTIIFRKNSVVLCSGVATFNNTKYATNGAGDAYIYVPRDLISTYQSATNWASLYAAHPNMFRPLEDYTVDGTTTGEFDEAMITTPQAPLYVATTADVSPDVEHPRTITTTAEGHITLQSGECSTEKWGYIWVSNTYIATSKQNNNAILTIAPGKTVKMTIRNLSFTGWGNTKNRLSFGLSTSTKFILEAKWADLKTVFNTNGETIYTLTYTNEGASNINIVALEFAGVLMSNQTLDFGLSVTYDDVRYI